MAAMQQQFTAALEGLSGQHADLQAALDQSRQQAANEIAALRQEVRAPLGGSSRLASIGAGTRLLRKPSDTSGSREAWWNWDAVFKEYAGAVVPKLQHLMSEFARTAAQMANATTSDDDGRTASAQLCWLLLMICQGAAWNIVLEAGDGEGLELGDS